MPGIDFDRLRREITMEQVLNLLGFEPSQRTGRPMVRTLSLARLDVRTSPLLLRERGHRPLLLPQVPQPRQPARTLGRRTSKQPLHPATIDLCRALGREVPWIHRW